jgi:hypothetical protein
MTQPQSATAPKAGWRQKLILTILSILFVAGMVAIVVWVRRSGVDVEKAKIGTCLEKSSDTDVSVIDCGDPDADFKVIGREENANRASATIFPCKSLDGVDSTVFVNHRSRFGGESEKGVVLCLAKVKK